MAKGLKGVKQVQQNMQKLTARIVGPITEEVMTQVLITGAAYAAAITPVDTSTLINSQYRNMQKIEGGLIGKVGYTSEYSLFVHEATGKLKGQPRATGTGDYWDPNGEPEFLRKGFERDGLDEIKSIIVKGYKV